MKFKLTDTRKQISDIEIINDLRTVANNLAKQSLKMRDYCKANGAKYNYQTAKKRFGNWKMVLQKAKLATEKSIHGVEFGESSIKEELLIKDMISVSKKVNNPKLTITEYEKHGKFGVVTITKRFGRWNKAKLLANLEVGRNYNTTVEDYMRNVLALWTHYGRQPKYAEVVKPFSNLHISSYENKFGTWKKALEAFIEYINNEDDVTVEEDRKPELVPINNLNSKKRNPKKTLKAKRTPRNINLRLRFTILKRDNFSCKKCGCSPAKNPKVVLHVDHIIPWSKGGETVIDNLETLCQDCNLGKSNVL